MNKSVRRLLWIAVVSRVGLGIPATVSALFATQVLSLDLRHVGVALTVAAAVAVALSTWLGHLADRLGARDVYAAMLALQAVGIAGLVWVQNIAGFALMALLIAVADLGQRSAQGAVVHGVVPPDLRLHTRAVIRVASNIGMAAGGALGGVVLALDRSGAYVGGLLTTTALLVVSTGLTFLLPTVPPTEEGAGGRSWHVLKDRPFVGFMALNGLLNIHNAMLQVAVPIWVVVKTDAPRWIVSILLGINVVAVILLQIRLSKGTDSLVGAAKAGRRAGLFLSLACVLLAVSDLTSHAVTIGLLLTAAVAHVVGEILESASAWGVSYAVAPPGMIGQYQGMHAMGRGLGDLIGPVLLTTVAISSGWPGWLLIALIFAAAGLITPTVVGHARTAPIEVRIN